jgi:hypothetical protein
MISLPRTPDIGDAFRYFIFCTKRSLIFALRARRPSALQHCLLTKNTFSVTPKTSVPRWADPARIHSDARSLTLNGRVLIHECSLAEA